MRLRRDVAASETVMVLLVRWRSSLYAMRRCRFSQLCLDESVRSLTFDFTLARSLWTGSYAY